jgi:hypothetical protein
MLRARAFAFLLVGAALWSFSLQAQNQNQNKAFGTFVSDVGISTAETLSQTTRIAVNVLTLNLPRAFSNLGDIVTGRGIDRFMIEFMEHLPVVVEQDLHLQYKASTSDAVGSYIAGQNLGREGAAALLSYIIESNKKEGKDTQDTIDSLKSAFQKIQNGGNKNAEQLGQELRQSMTRAIDRSPKPLPIPILRQLIGDSPIKDERILAIGQELSLDLLETQSLPFLKGEIAPILSSAEEAGIRVSGLNDSMLLSARDETFRSLGLRNCIKNAAQTSQIMDCITRLETQKNRAIGSTLNVWSPHLSSGRLKVEYQSHLTNESINVGSHLLETLRSNPQSHAELLRTGSAASLNRLGDDLGKRVVTEISDTLIREQTEKHFSRTPAQQQSVENNIQILRDNFLEKVRFVQGDEDLVSSVQAMLASHSDPEPHNALDAKIRKPFEDSLRDPKSKVALLAVALEKAPFTEAAKTKMLKEYEVALSKKTGHTIEFDSDLPKGFQSFLIGFDRMVHNTSFVPSEVSTMAYVKDLLDPNSSTLNFRALNLGAGTRDLFQYYINCQPSAADPHCDSLVEPYAQYISWVREAQNGLRGTSLENECSEKFPQIIDDVFNRILLHEENIAFKNPMELMKAMEGRKSQEAVNCFVTGQAMRRGFNSVHAENLYAVLEKSSDENADLRAQVVNDLHDYINPENSGGRTKSEAQRALLQNLEVLGKEVVRDFSHNYVDQFSASGSSPVHNLVKDSEHSATVHGIVDRMINNTQVLDENTEMSFEEYARHLAHAPLSANSAIDQSLQKSLDATLREPQTRRDFLNLSLGLHSELPKNGLLGPALERQIAEAYETADLNVNPPRFREGTSEGVKSFLTSFDTSVSGLAGKRRSNESVLQFLARASDPESRVLDEVIAEQSTGVRDLVMDLLRDPQACLGDKGNWIKKNPSGGAPEVLVNAPFAHILDFLKLGMRAGLDRNMNATCRAAIPRLIEETIATPSSAGAATSVLKDPTLFLDALKQPSNQTALNCIMANYMESKLLNPLRTSGVGAEAGIRSLLADLRTGVSRDAGLFNLSGEKIFEALEKRNSNAVLLSQKSDLVDSLRTLMKDDSRDNRQNVSWTSRDLTQSLVLSVVTDADFSHGVITGNSFPEPLRAWAQSHTMPRHLVSCIDNYYSRNILPWGMYAAKEVNSVLGNVYRPWIDSAPDAPRRPASTAPVASAAVASSAPEACVGPETFFGRRTGATGAPASSSPAVGVWVGGYEDTFKQWQDLRRADGSATLRPAGETAALSQVRDIQVAINHSQIGVGIVKRSSGLFEKGIASVVTIGSNAPEATRATRHLHQVAKFPVDEMIQDLENYKRSPTSQNLEAIRKSFMIIVLMKFDCGSVL